MFASITNGLTLATLLLEIVVPLLLFVPLWRAQLRIALVGIFISFHVALGLCLHLGLFSWVSALAWLALLPALAWQRAGSATRPGVDVDRSRTKGALVLAAIAVSAGPDVFFVHPARTFAHHRASDAIYAGSAHRRHLAADDQRERITRWGGGDGHAHAWVSALPLIDASTKRA